MRLVFLTVSNKLPSWLTEVTQDYSKKISYWLPTEVKVLKPANLSRDEAQKKKKLESEAIKDFIKPDDYVILCDERGKEFGSRDFAGTFERILSSGKKRIVIAIGGAYGIEEDLFELAHLKISLGKLTLNHHLAQAVIFEQIYRAMTIIKGVRYHNE